MFFDKTSENDFFAEVEKNLNKVANQNEDRLTDYKRKIVSYLREAEDILKNAGLVKEAAEISIFFNEDPETKLKINVEGDEEEDEEDKEDKEDKK